MHLLADSRDDGKYAQSSHKKEWDKSNPKDLGSYAWKINIW